MKCGTNSWPKPPFPLQGNAAFNPILSPPGKFNYYQQETMNGGLAGADSIWYFEEDIFKEPEEEFKCPLSCPFPCPLQKDVTT